MALRIFSRLRQLLDVIWGSPRNGQVLTFDEPQQKAKWADAPAPDLSDYYTKPQADARIYEYTFTRLESGRMIMGSPTDFGVEQTEDAGNGFSSGDQYYQLWAFREFSGGRLYSNQPANLVVPQTTPPSSNRLHWSYMPGVDGFVIARFNGVAHHHTFLPPETTEFFDNLGVSWQFEDDMSGYTPSPTTLLMPSADAINLQCDVTAGRDVLAARTIRQAGTPVSVEGHTHAMSDVTGLDDALAGKASLVHTHASADVSDASSTGAANKVAKFNAQGGISLTDAFTITKAGLQWPFKISDGTNDRLGLQLSDTNHSYLGLRGPYCGLFMLNGSAVFDFNDGSGCMALTQYNGFYVTTSRYGKRVLSAGFDGFDVGSTTAHMVETMKPGLIVRGIVDQVADFFQVLDSSGNRMYGMSAQGMLTVPTAEARGIRLINDTVLGASGGDLWRNPEDGGLYFNNGASVIRLDTEGGSGGASGGDGSIQFASGGQLASDPYLSFVGTRFTAPRIQVLGNDSVSGDAAGDICFDGSHFYGVNSEGTKLQLDNDGGGGTLSGSAQCVPYVNEDGQLVTTDSELAYGSRVFRAPRIRIANDTTIGDSAGDILFDGYYFYGVDQNGSRVQFNGGGGGGWTPPEASGSSGYLYNDGYGNWSYGNPGGNPFDQTLNTADSPQFYRNFVHRINFIADTNSGSQGGDLIYDGYHLYFVDQYNNQYQLDQQGGGGGNPFNQTLNTGDSVSFQRVQSNRVQLLQDSLTGGSGGEMLWDGTNWWGYDNYGNSRVFPTINPASSGYLYFDGMGGWSISNAGGGWTPPDAYGSSGYLYNDGSGNWSYGNPGGGAVSSVNGMTGDVTVYGTVSGMSYDNTNGYLTWYDNGSQQSAQIGGGYSGSFQTADGRTAYVSNGLITSIS